MIETLPIWPATEAKDQLDNPRLFFIPKDDQPRPVVLVLPGGGYGHLAPHEGRPIARALMKHGFHGAVLHYRLGPRHHHPAMLNDVQRAIRLLRANAVRWRIQGDSHGQALVGVMGFSAGGHLTSTIACHFDRFTAPQDDLAPRYSARPDAVGLCYPVVDLAGQFRHHGSMVNLLGENPDEGMVTKLSNHLEVRPDSPPAFLWHTADDGAVPVQNSLWYFQACLKQQVRAEMHIYESGQHGLGLSPKLPNIRTWANLCGLFMQRHLR